MEKELTAVINEYDLGDKIYFLNVTSIKDKDDLLDQVNKTLGLEDNKVKQIPTIIYYNDGKVVDMINKEGNSIMDIGDFQKLLDRNKV